MRSSSTGHCSPGGLRNGRAGRSASRKVEPGDEQILPPREQRELDALPSGLDRKRET